MGNKEAKQVRKDLFEGLQENKHKMINESCKSYPDNLTLLVHFSRFCRLIGHEQVLQKLDVEIKHFGQRYGQRNLLQVLLHLGKSIGVRHACV